MDVIWLKNQVASIRRYSGELSITLKMMILTYQNLESEESLRYEQYQSS